MEHNTQSKKKKQLKRQKGLKGFGVFQIVLGGICTLVVASMIISAMTFLYIPHQSERFVYWRILFPGMMIYEWLSACFIGLGIGSIKVKRWARTLTLAGSWIWLATGTVGFIWVLIITPDMIQTLMQINPIPPTRLSNAPYFVLGLLFMITIVLPGIFIFFYSKDSVRVTFENSDPYVRWTDRCPLPVLILSLSLGFGAAIAGSMFFYNSTVAFFGIIITGVPGTNIILGMIILLVYLSWGSYKLKMNAWRGTILLTIVGSLSNAITFLQVKLFEFCERMNIPGKLIEMMQQFDFMKNQTFALYMGIISLAVLFYVLYTHRYFAALSKVSLQGNGHETNSEPDDES